MGINIVNTNAAQVQAHNGHYPAGRDYTKLTINELDDFIDKSSRDVDAMICMCTGECFEGFDSHSEANRHAYLLAISDRSMELRAAIQARQRLDFLKKAA